MNNSKLAIYETALLRFGIIPILRILKKAEAEEDFEACGLIVDAINDINRLVGGTMPTRLEDVEIRAIKSAFDRFGGKLSGDDYVNNLDQLTREAADHIRMQINELNKNLLKINP